MPVTVSSSRAATVAVVKMLLAAACWGLNAVLAKYAFERGLGPVRLAEARPAVALAVLAPVLAWRRPELLRAPRGSLGLLGAFGVCIAAVNLAYYVAIDHVAVGVAISLQYTAPVLVLGVAVLVGGRRPGRRAWLAAALTLAGAVLVSRALEGLAGVDATGIGAGLASAVLFAAYLLSAEAAGRRGLHPAAVLLWGFVFAVALWSVAAPWWSWPVGMLTDPVIALAVVGVGVLGTLIPFLLAVSAVRSISAATASIAATAEPVFAATFAWLLLGQHLTATQLLGGGLVVAGVVLAQVVAGGAAREPAAVAGQVAD